MLGGREIGGQEAATREIHGGPRIAVVRRGSEEFLALVRIASDALNTAIYQGFAKPCSANRITRLGSLDRELLLLALVAGCRVVVDQHGKPLAALVHRWVGKECEFGRIELDLPRPRLALQRDQFSSLDLLAGTRETLLQLGRKRRIPANR